MTEKETKGYHHYMIEAALMILIVLFVLGYVNIPGVTIPNYHLYTLNHHVITLYEVLIFIVIFWVIGFAPRFLRIIAGALLIIWILSTFGIITVKGLPAIIVLALIGVTTLHRSFHWYRYYRRRYY